MMALAPAAIMLSVSSIQSDSVLATAPRNFNPICFAACSTAWYTMMAYSCPSHQVMQPTVKLSPGFAFLYF